MITENENFIIIIITIVFGGKFNKTFPNNNLILCQLLSSLSLSFRCVRAVNNVKLRNFVREREREKTGNDKGNLSK